MKEDKRICRGDSSRRPCRRENACSFVRWSIPTKNLQWLIRVQLAKRCGHRPQMRIAPGAAPVYIYAIRETNDAGDGKVKSTHPPVWKHKNPPPSKIQADGEVPREDQDTDPDVGEVHGDSAGIGYTALEIDLEKLVTCADEWAAINHPTLTIPWRDRSWMTDRQSSLESRWAQPQLQSDIEQWAMFYVDRSQKPFSADLSVGALTTLSAKGTSKKRMLELDVLVCISHVKDGHGCGNQS